MAGQSGLAHVLQRRIVQLQHRPRRKSLTALPAGFAGFERAEPSGVARRSVEEFALTRVLALVAFSAANRCTSSSPGQASPEDASTVASSGDRFFAVRTSCLPQCSPCRFSVRARLCRAAARLGRFIGPPQSQTGNRNDRAPTSSGSERHAASSTFFAANHIPFILARCVKILADAVENVDFFGLFQDVRRKRENLTATVRGSDSCGHAAASAPNLWPAGHRVPEIYGAAAIAI